MQQRIKNGVIKILDKDRKIMDALQLTNPEYLSFIIEACDCFYRNKSEAFRQLLNIQLMTEEFLTNIAADSNKKHILNVTHESVSSYKPERSKLSEYKIAWFKKNLGAISDRNIVG